MWFLILWGSVTILTVVLFVLLVADAYKRLLTYYKNLGIKCPKKNFSVGSSGSRFASLIKSIVIVTCPILHLLFLASLVLAYEEVCQKTVDSYILGHKKDEWELLKEKNNNEC